jgi:hypothetical protein
MCHGPTSPEYREFKTDVQKYVKANKGPKMDSYTHLVSFVTWPDTGSVMRRLDDGKNKPGGEPGNMYIYLGKDEAERQKNLGLFKKWIGYWSLKFWEDTSKEEINKMKVNY